MEVDDVGSLCSWFIVTKPYFTAQSLTYQRQLSHLARTFRAPWKLQLSSLTKTKVGSLRFEGRTLSSTQWPTAVTSHLYINLTQNILFTVGRVLSQVTVS